jgi:hypothetical protein
MRARRWRATELRAGMLALPRERKESIRDEGYLTRSKLVPSFGTWKAQLSRGRWLDEVETCPFVWDIYTSTKEEKGSKEEDLTRSTLVPSLGTSEHTGDRQGKLSRWGWFNEVKTCPLVLDLETWTRERKGNLKRWRWLRSRNLSPRLGPRNLDEDPCRLVRSKESPTRKDPSFYDSNKKKIKCSTFKVTSPPGPPPSRPLRPTILR